MKEIHSFENFSVSKSIGGDYFVEKDSGEAILILSPNGSEDHEIMAGWIESPERVDSDFSEYI